MRGIDSSLAAEFALGARWLLVVVFAIAIVGKLAARPSVERYLVSLGVKPRAATPAFWLLQSVEVVAIILLLRGPAARGGAFAAALFGIFAAVTALDRGEGPPCSCFGSLVRTSVRPHMARRLAVRGLGIVLALAIVVVGETSGQHPSKITAAAFTLLGIASLWTPGFVRGWNLKRESASGPSLALPDKPAGPTLATAEADAPQGTALRRRSFLKAAAITVGGVAGLVPGVGFAGGTRDHCEDCESPNQCICRDLIAGLSLVSCECLTHNIPDDTPPVYCCADCLLQCNICCEFSYAECVGFDLHPDDLFACSMCEGFCKEACMLTFLDCVGDGLSGSGECVTDCGGCHYWGSWPC